MTTEARVMSRACSPHCKGTLDRPEIVCICGSTRFKKELEQARNEETLNGHIVVGPEVLPHADGIKLDHETRYDLNELHLRKIDLADTVTIVTVNGYCGNGLQRELNYALSCGKQIRYVDYGDNPPDDNFTKLL